MVAARNNLIGPGRAALSPKKRGFGAVKPLILLFSMVLAVFGVNQWATHRVAQRYHFDPYWLGAPHSGGFYPPFSWIGWQLRLGPSDKLFFYGLDWEVIAGVVFSLLIIGGGLLIVGRRKAQGHEGMHGTAKFCETEDEVAETGLLPPKEDAVNSVLVGGWTAPNGELRYLRHTGPEHVMAVAPTRSGKGVGLIVPTLLTWTHSAVIHDIKGELWAMTSGWRARHAGNTVLKFDPAAAEGSCGYNILEEVRIDEIYAVGDIQNLVSIIVDPDGRGIEGDHWAGSAHALLTGLILYRLKTARRAGDETPNLFDIGWSLSDPTKQEAGLWDAMLKYTDPDADIAAVVQQTGRDQRALMEKGGEEYASVMSTTKRFLNIYRDPVVRKNITRSDFSVHQLVNSDKPVSLYLVVRPADKDRLRPVVRLLINQIMRVLTRDPLKFDKDNRPLKQHKHRMLMMMDEFPAFRKLEVFEENMAYIAGYGIKCYVICQDFNQLWKEYTENEAITSNCHIRVVYAPNRQETAEKISEMTGTMTVIAEDVSESGKQFGMTENVSRSYQNVARPLLTPDEVSKLKAPKKKTVDGVERIVEAGDMLIFAAGHNPIYGTQPLYFMDKTYLARSRVRPPEPSEREALMTVPRRADAGAMPVSGFKLKLPERPKAAPPAQPVASAPGTATSSPADAAERQRQAAAELEEIVAKRQARA